MRLVLSTEFPFENLEGEVKCIITKLSHPTARLITKMAKQEHRFYHMVCDSETAKTLSELLEIELSLTAGVYNRKYYRFKEGDMILLYRGNNFYLIEVIE